MNIEKQELDQELRKRNFQCRLSLTVNFNSALAYVYPTRYRSNITTI